MKRKLSFAVLAALGAFALVLLSGVPLPYPAHAQASPSVAVSLSSASVEEGSAIAVTMSFSGLEPDSDPATRDYVFRADVVGANECEDQAGGYGLGVDRYMYQVDEDPETRTGTISADCPAGDYTVQASISSPDDVELASARASFTVTAPAPAPTPEPTPDQEDPDPSVALALSPAGFAPWNTEISVTMLFGGLKADSDRDTTDYIFRADVVDADACEGGGLGIDRYMYQVDEDPETRSGTIAAGCPIGDYTIEASIATEADGVVASTSAEFSIIGPSIGLAIPATEQGAGGVLTLIFGSLAPDADADTTDYIFRADVVDADACEGDGLGVDRYIHQVDEDPETHTGTISADCPAGDYTLEASISSSDGVELASARASFSVAAVPPVEGEDGPPDSAQQQTTPVDITLDSQNGTPRGIWSDGTTVWVVDSQRHKLYAYTLSGGARDSGKDITLDGANRDAVGVWSDGTTIWVADSYDEILYAYTLSGGARDSGKDFDLASKPSGGTFAADDNGDAAGVWSNGTTIWVADATDRKLYAYTLSNGSRDTAKEFSIRQGAQTPAGVWADGTTIWVVYQGFNKALAYTISGGSRDAGLDLSLRIASDNWGAWSDGTTMWVGNTGAGNRKLFHHPLPGTSSTDAALSALSVSGVTLSPDFAADTTRYTASVANSVTSTTVTATKNDAAAEVVITPDDADTDADGHQVNLDVGSNTISVKVTAEDDTTTRTYTVTVTRAAPPASSDASLSALSLSGVTLSPAFSTATTRYTASVANSVSSTTVTAEQTDDDATVLITPTDADGSATGYQVGLNVGSNTITVKVTAADGATTRTYTVTVTRAAPPASSVDITLHSDNSAAYGIWSDGTTIWVVDVRDDKLYAYALADGTRLSSKEFALHSDNGNPRGIWSDGTTIWVEDRDADKLYAYALADGTRQDGSGGTTNKEFDLHGDNEDPTGIWSNGSTIWVADEGSDKLYAYGLTGTRRDVRDIDLHRDHHSPTGIWSDGDTIWGANSDIVDDKLYAYDLYKGTRLADLDLDLDSGNTFPRGIWSDGDTVWVADVVVDKLYAYALPKQPALSVRAMAPQIVYESQVTVTVTIRAETGRGATAPESAFDVTVHTEEGTAKLKTDYIPFSAKITFDPADFTLWGRQYRASKRVQFRIVGDITHESDEQLTIVVASSPSTPSGVPLESATITIRDDDEPRSPSNARQPRITYAVYDADLDAVVLEWAAGSDTDGLTGFKIEREAPTGTTAMVHADLIDDERPMLESSVLSMNDETAPASWVVFYRVWAVFSDGEKEKEVVSWWFPATMDRGIVRARITIEGSNVRFDVSWTDGLYYPDDGAGHDGFCSEGYKVYEQSNLGGFERWVDVTAVDTDPAERTHTVTTATTAYAKGAKIPYRVRCGGTSATTGLLIGEDTATVQ